MRVWLKNGTVYDPANGINGERLDIFVADGKIVEEPREKEKTRIIDAAGKAVLPGGIDPHSHVATYGLNLARFLFGFPTVSEVGGAYAKMGYTHVNEPLMTLNTANYVHHELSCIPILDTSAFLVLNLLEIEKEIREGEKEAVENAVLFLLNLTKAVGVKIYDTRVKYAKKGFFYRGVSRAKCLNFFRGAVPRVQLRTTPELLDEDTEVLSGFCLTNLAAGVDSEERWEAAKEVLKKGGSADLGVKKGVSADSVEKFVSVDVGLEQPLVFSKPSESGKVEAGSLRFALEALEFLRSGSGSGCCVSFSTDSPFGLPFWSYPKIFASLLNRENGCSLYELAELTRTNPARQLGLLQQNNGKGNGKGKGHLGVGADADIAVYDLDEKTGRAELERRLGCCEWLLKSGEVVVRAGRLCKSAGSAKKRSFFSCRRLRRERPRETERETERDRESQRETERESEKERDRDGAENLQPTVVPNRAPQGLHCTGTFCEVGGILV